jgi:DNA recombination protein RmuC
MTGMSLHETLLPALTLVGVVIAVVLLWRIYNSLDEDDGVETDQLTSALAQTFEDLEFQNKVSRIQQHAESMEELHTDIERMLQNPRERGEFGEKQLDVLLGEHLPPDMYGTQEQVVGNKVPDAHIKTPEGTVCIDSKFPLDNYEKYAKSEDEGERQEYQKQFAKDVEKQLKKIESDYVRPEEGTTRFAFAFIPSEGVYYHLITEEYDMLREYTKRGVQVVSPLTFGHKLELIKAGVQARKLSEQAQEINKRLDGIRAGFEELEDEWGTLQRHIRNAKNKADDVDSEYQRLRDEFNRIEGLSSD